MKVYSHHFRNRAQADEHDHDTCLSAGAMASLDGLWVVQVVPTKYGDVSKNGFQKISLYFQIRI